MSEFKSRLEGGGALSLLRAVGEGNEKWLCCTNYLGSEATWQIQVSDGVRVWSASLSESDTEKLAGRQPYASFIRSVSCCLEEGEIELVPGASYLTLCLKLAPQPLQLELSELTGPQTRVQLCGLIFDLWTRLETAQRQLADCQKQLEQSRKEPNTSQDLVLVDSSRSFKSSSSSSRAKRPAGASLINPSMKRRKAVKGVVFGDSQD